MSEKTQDQGGPDETIAPGLPLPHPHDPDAPRVGPS
jgi:hypothetical protein